MRSCISVQVLEVPSFMRFLAFFVLIFLLQNNRRIKHFEMKIAWVISLISMYIHICSLMCINTHTCSLMWMYIHICSLMCMYTNPCLLMCMYIYISTLMCMYIRICSLMCMYIYARLHAMHIFVQQLSLMLTEAEDFFLFYNCAIRLITNPHPPLVHYFFITWRKAPLQYSSKKYWELYTIWKIFSKMFLHRKRFQECTNSLVSHIAAACQKQQSQPVNKTWTLYTMCLSVWK